MKIETYPGNVDSLPLDPVLKRRFALMGDLKVNMNLALMRLAVSMATRLQTPVLYDAGLVLRRKGIHAGDRTIPLRIVSPPGAEKLPVLIYFHGGGGVLGDSWGYTRVLRNICSYTGAVVVSVDYRRGPEFPFPAALQDCREALRWVSENAVQLGGDSARVILAGDSMGGCLAAGLSLYVREHGGPVISKMVLVNPVTDQDSAGGSLETYGKGYGLSYAAIRMFRDKFLATGKDADNIYISPLRAENLGDLPPAFIISCEYDPLRDEGENLAKAIHLAGGNVRLLRYAGMAHTIVSMGCTRETARHFLNELHAFIQSPELPRF